MLILNVFSVHVAIYSVNAFSKHVHFIQIFRSLIRFYRVWVLSTSEVSFIKVISDVARRFCSSLHEHD